MHSLCYLKGHKVLVGRSSLYMEHINTTPTFRMFGPEQWGQVDRFKQFYEGTFSFPSHIKKAVSGVGGHFEKAGILIELANNLAPSLENDIKELRQKGVTRATNSRQISAVVESVFIELYSSVDCMRTIISHMYKSTRGMPDSTRKLFQRIHTDGLGCDFPWELKVAFRNANWYEELRIIRDELTHSSLGSCQLDSTTKKISYYHFGIKRQNLPLQIENVFELIESFRVGVNLLLGQVFYFLNSLLKPTPTPIPCGMFKGRIYMRMLVISEKIDFDSGVCMSRQWFDKEPDYCCPFSANCAAYNCSISTLSSRLVE